MSTAAFKTTPIDSLLAEAFMMPLKLRREKAHLDYAARILSNESHPLYSRMKKAIKSESYDQSIRFQTFVDRSVELNLKYKIIEPYSNTTFDSRKFHALPFWQTKNFDVDLSNEVQKIQH